jgi:hypothetical protein
MPRTAITAIRVTPTPMPALAPAVRPPSLVFGGPVVLPPPVGKVVVEAEGMYAVAAAVDVVVVCTVEGPGKDAAEEEAVATDAVAEWTVDVIADGTADATAVEPPDTTTVGIVDAKNVVALDAIAEAITVTTADATAEEPAPLLLAAQMPASALAVPVYFRSTWLWYEV